MAINKIGISFKSGETDLYNFLKNQMSPSIFVKQLLKAEMEKQKPKSTNSFDF